MAIRLVDPREPAGITTGLANPYLTPAGYGPSSLQSAYALPSSTAGSGQTVGIVDAYDDPNAESDLATYRSQYGLPACTTANGCFRKVNQNGASSPLPSGNTGWAGEISLDVDMVSAVCPNCHILLAEASSAYLTDLGTAVNTAVILGAKFVSNSYGAAESGSENSYDSSYFHHPGVAITASTGDSDYDGGSYPATSAYVTAVGGTSLRTASNSRGWTETVWNTTSYTEGTGSGCSQDVAKPSFQSGINTGCSRRAEADVSAVADPATGVAVYQTYGGSGWMVYGGTSAASPIVASVYALAGTPGASDTPNAYPYAHTGSLNDVTSGSNGTCGAPLCTAGAGWDGPTGLGTPNGITAFTPGGGDTARHLRQFYVANGSWVSFDVSAATGTAIASDVSPNQSGEWARDTAGHLRQFYVANGSWVSFDVSAATGVAMTGDPFANNDVWARDTAGHLRQFYVANGSWVSFDVSAATGVTISGNPMGNGSGVWARDTAGHLRQFYVANGSWMAFDVSAATGTTIASDVSSNQSGEWARDTSGHLRQFYVANGSWVSFDVSAATGVTVTDRPYAGTGGEWERDTAGHLRQFYVANGSWTAFDVSAATGVDIVGNASENSSGEWARDPAGHLRQFYVSNGSWVSFDVSAATGVPIVGDPAATSGQVWAAG